MREPVKRRKRRTAYFERRADFILEWLSVDRLSALSGARWITGLDHEPLDVSILAIPSAPCVVRVPVGVPVKDIAIIHSSSA